MQILVYNQTILLHALQKNHPCLDVKDRRTVKGVNFKNLRNAGDAVALAKYYSDNGADELVFLDISATNEGRKTMVDFIDKSWNSFYDLVVAWSGILERSTWRATRSQLALS